MPKMKTSRAAAKRFKEYEKDFTVFISRKEEIKRWQELKAA